MPAWQAEDNSNPPAPPQRPSTSDGSYNVTSRDTQRHDAKTDNKPAEVSWVVCGCLLEGGES